MRVDIRKKLPDLHRVEYQAYDPIGDQATKLPLPGRLGTDEFYWVDVSLLNLAPDYGNLMPSLWLQKQNG